VVVPDPTPRILRPPRIGTGVEDVVVVILAVETLDERVQESASA